MLGNSSQSFQNFPIRLPQQKMSSISTNYDPGRKIAVKHTDQVSKRTRSPPLSSPNGASFENSAFGLRESKRYNRKILAANSVYFYFDKHTECQWKGLPERCKVSRVFLIQTKFFPCQNYFYCYLCCKFSFLCRAIVMGACKMLQIFFFSVKQLLGEPSAGRPCWFQQKQEYGRKANTLDSCINMEHKQNKLARRLWSEHPDSLLDSWLNSYLKFKLNHFRWWSDNNLYSRYWSSFLLLEKILCFPQCILAGSISQWLLV